MKLPRPLLTRTSSLPALALTAFTLLAAPAAHASPSDLDEDGITNRVDPDVDGDGIPNGEDRNVDGGICKKGPKKGKFVGDHLNNGNPLEKDIDGDGIRNGKDDDCDGDRKGRAKDSDDDGDGKADKDDNDDDNDGLSDDDENEVEKALAAAPDAPDGSRVRAKVKLLPSGKIELEFDGRGLEAGGYDVVVDGQILGSLAMTSDKAKSHKNDRIRTKGEVHFETNPNKPGELPLPFNPFGLPVLIVKEGVSYFSGTVPTPTDVFTDDDGDDDNGGGDSFTADLVKGSGLSDEAEAQVEIQIGLKGVTGLEVEAEGIPVGVYDFIVDGTNRGALSVVLVKGKAKGKLRYETKPDGNDELLLDFAVAGKAIVISQGAVTFFSGTGPAPK